MFHRRDPAPASPAGLSADAGEYAQALAVLSDGITALRSDSTACDVLLDLTNLLRPPQPTATAGRREAALDLVEKQLRAAHHTGKRALLEVLLDVRIALAPVRTEST